MAFQFQGMEWVIILVAILLIFGPKKLPELARGIGQALYEFKRASHGIIEEEEKKEEAKEAKKSEAVSETAEKAVEKMGGEVKVEAKN